MKSRRTAVAIIAVLGAGFWLYGIGRTMRETVNFNTTAFLFRLLLGVVIPLMVLLPALVTKKLWLRERLWPVSLLLVVFASPLLVGSLASELWIPRDEARFFMEVSTANDRNLYSRPRAWPNQTCSLVFVPGNGIHSTY